MILDNAEQVLGAVAELADAVIRSCPRVCLLVTSREPLGISGEHVFRVPGLAVPPADLAAPDRLAAFESVQLFAEHAALHRRGFIVDDANAAAVAAICVRLDGIPLALELAAARLGSLSASEINARLDQRFRLLTTGNRTALPRHQTLRALIDWSYDLLSPEERIVFDRLSVFAGGWTLDAAEAVASGGDVAEWQVLDLLAALVGKSLVQAEVIHGSTRYRLLETVRHYAAERLALRAGSDLQDARVAHRDHYLSLVETAAARLRGPDEHRWLDRIEAEFDNIRAALAFSIADPGSAEPGLRLAAGLRSFVFSRGHSGEVIEALGALLGRPDARQPTRYLALALVTNCKLLTHFDRSPDIPAMAEEAITIARGLADDALAADALAALNWFSFLQGDLPAALARADDAVALARAAGSPIQLVVALGHRAVFKAETGDLDASLADYQEVLSLARASGDNYTLVVTLVNLGVDQVTAGEFPAALAYLQDALRVADAHGYQHLSAAAEMNLGFAYLMNGDAASARRLLVGVLDRARATSEMTWVHSAFLGLALAAGADAEPAVAATLHGAADHQYEQAGQAFDAKESKMRTSDHARLRDALGEAAFDAAYQHGRTLSQVDAIALALSTARPDPGPAASVTVPARDAEPQWGPCNPARNTSGYHRSALAVGLAGNGETPAITGVQWGRTAGLDCPLADLPRHDIVSSSIRQTWRVPPREGCPMHLIRTALLTLACAALAAPAAASAATVPAPSVSSAAPLTRIVIYKGGGDKTPVGPAGPLGYNWTVSTTPDKITTTNDGTLVEDTSLVWSGGSPGGKWWYSRSQAVLHVFYWDQPGGAARWRPPASPRCSTKTTPGSTWATAPTRRGA